LSIAILTIFVGGLGVTLLALGGEKRVNVAEAGALSWFFGTGLISLLLWSAGLLFKGALLQTIVTLLALALGFFGIRQARIDQMRVIVPSPRNLIEWILAGGIAIQSVLMLYASLS